MRQLDVQADDEALELELEVEQLLREQEAEAARQMAPVERLSQPDGEGVSSELTEKNKEPQKPATSPETDKSGKCCSSSPRRLDCPDPGAQNFPAAVAT